MSIVFQCCAECGRVAFPDRWICAQCGGTAFGSIAVASGVVAQVTEAGGVHIVSLVAAGIPVVASSTAPVSAGSTVALRSTRGTGDPTVPHVYVPGAAAPEREGTG